MAGQTVFLGEPQKGKCRLPQSPDIIPMLYRSFSHYPAHLIPLLHYKKLLRPPLGCVYFHRPVHIYSTALLIVICQLQDT
jgi:hypothetical protein